MRVRGRYIVQLMYCRSGERARALGHAQRWYVVSLKAERFLVEHGNARSREGESFGTKRHPR